MSAGTKREAIVQTLEFYKALGFTRMPITLPEGGDATPEDKAEALERLRHELGDCKRCKLCDSRKNIVFGEGNPGAEIMFIGERPGRDEDVQGRPFVGAAGNMLDRLIYKMNYRRDEVYIGNIIKCRPPGNRDPEEDEITSCMPFVSAQVHIINPKVIITLGRVSAHTLLGTTTPISKLRGKFADFHGIKLLPTFHPAYLLRNSSEMVKVLDDAMKVLSVVGRQPREGRLQDDKKKSG